MIATLYVHSATAKELDTAKRILALVECEHDKVVDVFRNCRFGPDGHLPLVCGTRANNLIASCANAPADLILLPSISSLTPEERNDSDRRLAFDIIQSVNTKLKTGEIREDLVLSTVLSTDGLPDLTMEQVKQVEVYLLEEGLNEWCFKLSDGRRVVVFLKKPEVRTPQDIYISLNELMLVYLAMKTLQVKEVTLERNRDDDVNRGSPHHGD